MRLSLSKCRNGNSLATSTLIAFSQHCKKCRLLTSFLLPAIRLYICQKRVIRIICGSSRRAHSIPLFKQMNILPVYCMNDLQTACFMFSSINSLLPKCFNDMFILNANIHTHFTRMNNALHQTQYRLNCSKFALRTHGPVLWNSLPPGLKSLPNLKIFRRHYKQHLMSQL